MTVFLPIGIVLGPRFFWVAPGQATWHALFKDLRAAWAAFSFRLAPVPELPGLVLATAWAAGAAGLLAELISSMRRVPAVFALTPALGLYLFASALGTDSWRVAGLAAMAGSACWYLVAAVRERERGRGVLVAWPDAGLSAGERTTSYRAGALIFRMAALSALSAAVIGPNLPGARSAALVSWHGVRGTSSGTGSVVPGAIPRQGVEISTLVQVAQAEVDDPSVALFTVHSRLPTRETMAALDEFNGNRWRAVGSTSSTVLASFSTPLAAERGGRPQPGRTDRAASSWFRSSRCRGSVATAFPVGEIPSQWTISARVGSGGTDGMDRSSRMPGCSAERFTPWNRSWPIRRLRSSRTTLSTSQTFMTCNCLSPCPCSSWSSPSGSWQERRLPTKQARDLDAYLTSARFHYRLP